MKNDVDVIVIGAGPVGLTLTHELIRQGLNVRVFDQSPVGESSSRAVCIHVRTLEMLDGMGIIDDFIEAGRKVKRINIYSDGTRIYQARLIDLKSPYKYALDLPQWKTEEILTHKVEKRGTCIERPFRLIGLRQNEKDVTTVLECPGGENFEVTAPYLIGCDGAKSTVREQIGVSFEASPIKKKFLLVDASMNWGQSENGWHLYYHGDGIVLFFPYGGGKWRIIAGLQPDDNPEETVEYIENLIKSRGITGLSVNDLSWSSILNTRHGHVSNYQVGRVFLAGDAAHVHDPSGGQGMNAGIQDACNLAWKLPLVIKGKAGTGLLSSYNCEREPVGRQVERFTRLISRVTSLSNPIGTSLRDRLFPFLANIDFVNERLIERLEELDYNYRRSTIVREDTSPELAREERTVFDRGPRAGDRAPDGFLTLPGSGESIQFFELLRDTRHVLLLMTTYRSKQKWIENVIRLAAKCENDLSDVIRPCIVSERFIRGKLAGHKENLFLDPRLSFHHKYGSVNTGLYLIRPDGYIAYRNSVADYDAFMDYLNSLLGC